MHIDNVRIGQYIVSRFGAVGRVVEIHHATVASGWRDVIGYKLDGGGVGRSEPEDLELDARYAQPEAVS